MNIAEEIFLRANPRAVAVIEKGCSWTYGDLERRSREVMAQLPSSSAQASRPLIGLRGQDGMTYLALALGILRSGACLVPLATELSPSERETLVATLALDAVITTSVDPLIPFSLEVPEKKGVLECRESLKRLNPAFIRFSSGTTGAAKGIVLSHESLRDRIEAANAGLKIGPEDRVLWVLSMAHHFVVSILLYLWHGAAVVLPETHLPGDMLVAARDHQATVLYAAPCHYLFLTSGNEEAAWPSLRLAVSTTAPLQAETAVQFASRFGITPVQALGIMEVGLPFLNHSDPVTRLASVGTPQEGFQVELRNPQGDRVREGERGELFLKGPGMFDAYVSPWRTREEVTQPDGWFSTGDIAVADAQGFITILGRSKSVINVGGMKFFPEEVESVLCSHPGVAEARVLGITHPIFGSVPVAEVVTSLDAEVAPGELASLCRKQLARYKLPVEIRFVESIPKTPSGKISRASSHPVNGSLLEDCN